MFLLFVVVTQGLLCSQLLTVKFGKFFLLLTGAIHGLLALLQPDALLGHPLRLLGGSSLQMGFFFP
ncbi:hypothetical protein D3C76_1762240 [compost metagenome]